MKLTRLKIGLLTAVVFVALGTTVAIQSGQHQRLQAEHELMQTQAREIGVLASENSRLEKIRISTNELESLRDEHFELLKLRGDVAMLRRDIQAETLRAENRVKPERNIQERIRTGYWTTLSQDTNSADYPKFIEAKRRAERNVCTNNLEVFAARIARWALENNKADTDKVDDFILLEGFPSGGLQIRFYNGWHQADLHGSGAYVVKFVIRPTFVPASSAVRLYLTSRSINFNHA